MTKAERAELEEQGRIWSSNLEDYSAEIKNRMDCMDLERLEKILPLANVTMNKLAGVVSKLIEP